MSNPINTPSTLIPSLRYRDAHAAIDWLTRVLGFTRSAVYDGPNNTVAHAQLTLGGGMVMLGSSPDARGASEQPSLTEADEQWLTTVYVVVGDCDPVYRRAQDAGAHILQPLQTMEYGGRAFTLRDPEGYRWAVGEYDPWAETK